MVKIQKRNVSGFLFAGLILLAIGGYFSIRAEKILGNEGSTEAVVTSKHISYSRSSRSYYLHYRYAVNGKSIDGSSSVSRSDYDSTSIGSSIPIEYDQANPSISSSNPNRDLYTGLVAAGIGLGASTCWRHFHAFRQIQWRVGSVFKLSGPAIPNVRVARTVGTVNSLRASQ